MNLKENIKKLLILLIIVLSVCFWLPAKTAQAIFGIPGTEINFSITLKDLAKKAEDFKKKYGKFGEIAFQTLRRRYLTQIQNDLVNWVQGNGKPRFVTDPSKFLKEGLDFTAAAELDRIFNAHGMDICSPFKANVQFLVTKPIFLPEQQLRCSFSNMKENMEKFATNFEDGGWTTWLKLHETRNTLPGAYLGAVQLLGSKLSRQGNTLNATLSAGGGFLDQKKCIQVAKAKSYDVEYTIKKGPNAGEIYEDILDRIPNARDKDGNYDWAIILSASYQTHGVNADDVDIDSIKLVPFGDFLPPEDIEPISTSDLSPDAKCTKEIIETPGRVVGDWVSGGLKDLSLGPLINATDIGQIVNAVIDAAVNRAARSGLAHMKSGPGSYTQATKAGGDTYYGNQKIQTQNVGQESSEATDLLNKILSFQNSTNKLIQDINSLIQGEEKEKTYKDTIEAYANSFAAQQRINGEGDGLDDVVDKVYNDFANLGDESANPGPYIANKVFQELMSEKWKHIATILENMSTPNSQYLPNSCQFDVPNIRFFTSPRKEALPFTNGDGKIFVWWNKKSGSHWYDNLIENPLVKVTNWKDTYLRIHGLPEAKIQASSHSTIADNYDKSIQNAKKLSVTFQNDLTEIGKISEPVSQYASLLLDYDAEAESSGAIGALQNYISESPSAQDAIALEDLRKSLLHSQWEAREQWYNTQNDIAKNKDGKFTPDEQTVASNKAKLIKRTNDSVDLSLRKITAESPDLAILENPPSKNEIMNSLPMDGTGGVIELLASFTSTDFIKDGVGPAAALASSTAMNLNISQISSDLEQRAGRVNTYQSDTDSIVGSFLPRDPKQSRDDNSAGETQTTLTDKRKNLGVTGGDTEWEKYYQNRFQLAYAVYIDSFYSYLFKCQEYSALKTNPTTKSDITRDIRIFEANMPPQIIPD